MLRRHATSIGYDSNYSILDSEDARDLINVCIDDAAIDTKAKRFPKAEVVQDIISYANNTDLPIENVIVGKYPYFEMLTQQIKRVDSIYQVRKQERNVMDYDDLLLNVKKLLIEKPEIADLYAEQFQHILVDEYQDTNRLQAEIIDLLAVKHRNVMVVGDDAQSIFAWRGAEFTNIYEFPKRYPEAQLFKLETNYRSTPEILGLANTSIAYNRKQFPKVLTGGKAFKGLQTRAGSLLRCRAAVGVCRLAHSGTSRRGHKPRRHRRDVPLALSFDRTAARTDATEHSVSRPIRRSIFRAGSYQGRHFVLADHREPA